MIFDNGTNVGVNTTSPTYRLHVSGSSGPTIMIQSADNTGGQFRAKNTAGEFVKGIEGSTNGGWMDYDVINSQYITLYRTGSLGFYTIYTNGGERITVKGDGNVGINTTNATGRFEVKRASSEYHVVLNSSHPNSASFTQYQINSSGGWEHGMAGLADSYKYYFSYGAFGASNAKVTFQNDGNVGIGTTSPALRLQVDKSTQTYNASSPSGAFAVSSLVAGNAILELGVDPTALAYIQSRNLTSLTTYQLLLNPNGGNVGIGTTNPSSRLTVTQTSNAQGQGIRLVSGSDYWEQLIDGGNLWLGANGSNRVYILNNGNVGISTTSPASKLHISGSTSSMLRIESQDNSDSTPIVYIEGNKGGSSSATAVLVELKSNIDVRARGINMTTADSNARWFAGVSYNGGSTSGYQIGYDDSANRLPYYIQSSSLFIDTSRNVMIGGTSPGGKLTIDPGGTTYSIYAINQGLSWGSGIRIQAANANNGYFVMAFVSGSQYGSLQAGDTSAYRNISLNHQGGNVGIGTTSPSYKADISGSTRVLWALAVGNIAPSATKGRIDAENDVVAFSTSDMRFKTNITPISNALEKITQIGGYEFDWIPNQELHGFEGHDVGVIAQEIEKVLPEVIKERNSGYKAVKYEKIVPLLIEAIKEQQKQIDELKNLIQNGSTS
jgi:hypothetical protein